MVRPWYRSTWVRLGVAISLLGLIVVLAIPFLIPVDLLRPPLVRLIEASTGRQVQIGALRLHLLPMVHLQALNIRLENPPGFPRGDAISVKSIDFGVAPRALLSRRLDVRYIAIGGIRVNLLRDHAGRTNFDLSAPPGSAPAGRTSAAAGGVPFLTFVQHVGAVTVTNVEITSGSSDARLGQATPSFTLSGLNARIRSVDPNAPDWPRRLEIVVDLRRARLTTPSLAKPVQFRTGELLVKDGAGRGTFSASLDSMGAEVTAAMASLDPLSMTFTVAIPELDLNRLQSLVISSPKSRSSEVISPASSSADRQAPPGLQRLLARGEVKIDRLILSPLEVTRMRSRLSIYPSTIQVDSYALSAYGGTVQGAATLDYSAASLPAAVTAKVSGVNLGRLVSTFPPQARKVTGTLETGLTLATALGRDPRVALTGGGTFAVRNGSFPGLDLKSNLAQMAKALQLNVPTGDTRFSYFGGDLRIAQERVYSNALRLDAEGLEATSRGSIGFNKTLDYTGTGVLRSLAPGASSEGQAPSAGQMLSNVLQGAVGTTGIRVPFSLRGTVDDPKFSLVGTPQQIRDQSRTQQPPQQPALPFAPQDLFKLFQ
jgi:uncharacterized protein involved in outer membrane biogenesis